MLKRISTFMIALLFWWAVPAAAVANGNPLRAVLSYMPNVSNWGPQEATGVAEVVLAEGEVRLVALGLPRLEGGAYMAWLMNTKTGQAFPLGRFNADEKREARLASVLPKAIPDEKWDLLIVSVETGDAVGSSPGPRRSIAGAIADYSQAAGIPQQLPRTGGPGTPNTEDQQSRQDFWPLVVACLIGIGIGAAGAWTWQRRRKIGLSL